MDIVELIDEQLEELENISMRRIVRPRIIKVRTDYFSDLDRTEFFFRFRLSKNSVISVHNLIKYKIMTKTQRNQAVSSMVGLLLTLRYLATGSYLRTAADFCGVSPPTASRIVLKVTTAIAQLRPQIIKFPNDLDKLKEGFYRIAKFPRVLAAIDCTHVAIRSPGGDSAENYRDRKSNFSINVQVACDSQLRCLDIVARWPGSVHDQTIFNNSSIKQKFEMEQYSGFLLGDSGYELKPYLLTPFLSPSSAAENLYNESHIRTRNTIERCFGVVKNRFPVLRRQITLKLEQVQCIIVSCFVLHNIAIDAKERNFGDHSACNIDVPEPAVSNLPLLINDTRRRLVHEYFTPLLNVNQ